VEKVNGPKVSGEDVHSPHTRGIVISSALLTALRPHPVKRQGPRSGEVLVGKKNKVEVEVQYRCGSMRTTCLLNTS